MKKYYVVPMIPSITAKEAVVCEYVSKIYDDMNHIRRIIRNKKDNECDIKVLNDIYYRTYMILGLADMKYVECELKTVLAVMRKFNKDNLLEKNALEIVSKKKNLISCIAYNKSIKKIESVLTYIQAMMSTNEVLIDTVNYINNEDYVM